MLIIVMLNNTIEYYEVKFNERYDSIISTLRSFSAKLSDAINQGIVNLTLIVSGIYAISRKLAILKLRLDVAKSSTMKFCLRLMDLFQLRHLLSFSS